MDLWNKYDDLDFESIVRYGSEEDEEYSPEEFGFMRGYLDEAET